MNELKFSCSISTISATLTKKSLTSILKMLNLKHLYLIHLLKTYITMDNFSKRLFYCVFYAAITSILIIIIAVTFLNLTS